MNRLEKRRHGMLRVLVLCVVPLLAMACGGSDGESSDGPGGTHFEVTVTGPAWPDGRKITIVPEDIVFSVFDTSTYLIFNGMNKPDAQLIAMTMTLAGGEGAYQIDEVGNGFTLGGIDDDRSMKEESGTITLEIVTRDRVRGTIDATLRGTQISRKDEIYSVVGSFDLRDDD